MTSGTDSVTFCLLGLAVIFIQACVSPSLFIRLYNFIYLAMLGLLCGTGFSLVVVPGLLVVVASLVVEHTSAPASSSPQVTASTTVSTRVEWAGHSLCSDSSLQWVWRTVWKEGREGQGSYGENGRSQRNGQILRKVKVKSVRCSLMSNSL